MKITWKKHDGENIADETYLWVDNKPTKVWIYNYYGVRTIWVGDNELKNNCFYTQQEAKDYIIKNIDIFAFCK